MDLLKGIPILIAAQELRSEQLQEAIAYWHAVEYLRQNHRP